MIRYIQALRKKYTQIRKNSEYVSIDEVQNMLYRIEQEMRVRRLPKDQR